MSNTLLNQMILIWEHARWLSGISYIVIIIALIIAFAVFLLTLYSKDKKGNEVISHGMTKLWCGTSILILAILGMLCTSQNHAFDNQEAQDFIKIKANRETAHQIPYEKSLMNTDNNIYIVYNKRHSSNLAQIRKADHARKQYLKIDDRIRARQKFNKKHNHPLYPRWYRKL